MPTNEIPLATLGASEQWTQRVGSFMSLPALIDRLGGDATAILRDAGLAPDAFDALENRVPYSALGRVLRNSAQATGCAHIGLLLGRMWRLSDLGIVGHILRNSPTLREALRALTDYQHLTSEGALAFVLDRGPVVDVGFAIYQPAFNAPRVMYDALAAITANLMRELCGPGWRPSEVLLPHAQPEDVSQYRNLFKAPLHFNAEICALRFPRSWMAQLVEGADEDALRAAKATADRAPAPDLLQQAYRSTRALLLQERHSGDDLARTLNMHRRTLNRRLREEGVTFQQVLDRVRCGVARELLAASEISLDDLAATLGYSGVTPFMRTFARWTGTTPGRWRRNASPLIA